MAYTAGAVGKVATGFSLPYVARYSATGGEITFSGGMRLARGVDVDLSPDTPDGNDFYADNQLSESGATKFVSGTLNLTVDGLLVEAERFIMGLPAAGTDGWTAYGDSALTPFVGVGFLVRYMSGGVESWVPIVVIKSKFNLINTNAATQEEEIDWQTQALTAKVYRSDNSNHDWKWIGADYTTESEAETALKTKLNIQ